MTEARALLFAPDVARRNAFVGVYTLLCSILSLLLSHYVCVLFFNVNITLIVAFAMIIRLPVCYMEHHEYF